MVTMSAFFTSLVTSLVVFVILVILFSILSRRPSNAYIYYPNRILHGQEPPDLVKKAGVFTWIKEAYSATDAELVAMGGLDAWVYTYFFTTALEILLYSAVFCIVVLIPICVTSHNNAALNNVNNTYVKIDNLAMGNIPNKSAKIWAFFLAAFWVSFVTFYVLWKSYKWVSTFRIQDQTSAKVKPEQFAVLVRDIPKPEVHQTRSEQVDSYFRKLHPGTYEKCLVACDISKAEKLYLEIEKIKLKLEHAQAVYELSKGKGGDGVRPTHKTGFLGLVGAKVDSIDYYNEKLKELIPNLEKERTRALADEQQGAAFAFFSDRRSAAEASQVVHSPDALKWQVYAAPEPREVIWSNLAKPVSQRALRKAIVYVVVFLIILFFMIPILFISALTTLNNLETLLPFIKAIVKIKALTAVIQAFLPQLALIIFLALLPSLLMALSKAEGIPSKSHVARATSGKYFYFIVFNVFLGISIFGTIFASLAGFKQLIQSTGLTVSYVVKLFGQKLPPLASLFITYVALKFFIGYGLNLSRVVPLVIYHLKRKYLCKTEKEIQAAWAPGSLSYHTNVPNDMLIMTLALCYSVIAPLILVFAILYFLIGWLIVRNQVLNVYVPEWESGGRMWPHINNRILAALFVSQITMLGFFGVKEFPYTVLLIALPVMTVAFYFVCKLTFYPAFAHLPLAIASEEMKEIPSLASIVEAYTPACLLEGEQFEDAKFEDAQSNVTSRTNSGITSPA
jgi:hypothetical protein